MKEYYSREEMQELDLTKLPKEGLIKIASDTLFNLQEIVEDGGFAFLQKNSKEYTKIENLLKELDKRELTNKEKSLLEDLEWLYNSVFPNY